MIISRSLIAKANSVNVQIIADQKLKIRNVVECWRGSLHDARMWNECQVKEKFHNGILLGDNHGWIPMYRIFVNTTTFSNDEFEDVQLEPDTFMHRDVRCHRTW